MTWKEATTSLGRIFFNVFLIAIGIDLPRSANDHPGSRERTGGTRTVQSICESRTCVACSYVPSRMTWP